MFYRAIKKIVSQSAAAEKAALDIYEKLPLYVRYRLYGPVFLRWMTVLKDAECWDQEKLQAFQLEQARALLVHSKKHVPYYRKLFSASGFGPERMQSLDDLRQLPYLTKETIRDHMAEFVDERIPLGYLIKKPTGGTSGIPVTIYRSRENEAAFMAFRTNILSRVGYTPKEKEVMFWPEVQLGNKSVPFVKYGNRLILSIRYCAGEWPVKYLDMIHEFEPRFVLGYPSALTILAKIARENRRSPYRNIHAVISYSETLHAWQRELLQETFRARIFSMFGMTERSAIGGECENSLRLHFHPLYGITDFENTNHECRELIATGFTNYEMPFIRYRTGDLASGYNHCCDVCKRRHPVVSAIEGRSHELLVGRNSELIPILSSWIGTFHNVLQYQFIQKQLGIVCLNIVPTEKLSESDNDHIVRCLERVFGQAKDALTIELKFVDHIPRTSSGKTKMVEQQLDIHSLVVGTIQ